MSRPRTPKTITALARAAAAPLLALLLASCAQLRSAFEQPAFVISLNRVVQPGAFAPDTLLIYQVSDSANAPQAAVSKFPIVDSSCFGDVQLVEGRDGKWGLRLKMDKRGLHLWRTATAQYHGLRLAIVVDGFFAGLMDFPAYDESGYVMLPPLWPEDEARRIAEHVVSNYRHFNSR